VCFALQKSAQHEPGDNSRGKAIFLVATAVITSRWEIAFLCIIRHHFASPTDMFPKQIFLMNIHAP
jgi:hypothetical protein